MEYKKLNNVELENANIFNLNFNGIEGQYNPAGRRNFCVEIPDELSEQMERDGWNIKHGKPKKNNPDEKWPDYLKVNVSWKNPRKQPEIFMVTSKKKILMNENTVGRLDSADIQNVDLVIEPSFWSRADGSSGYSAYVKAMWVTIAEPSFADKYDDFPEDDEEVSFK